MSDRVYCSFCGRADHEVAVMVAGPALTFICDECVGGCAAVVADKKRELAMTAEMARCAGCEPSPLSVGLRFAAHLLNGTAHG